MQTDSMLRVLGSERPAADLVEKMELYGRFIGSWAGEVVRRSSDGTETRSTCEVHFGYVLEGRAIQDVWIVPARKDRGQDIPSTAYNLYGTTLRIYDPKADVWHINWFNPVKQTFNRMTGRPVGADIVNEYITEEGMRCQWMFTEITPNSFHWIGRGTTDGGATWFAQTEFFLKRVH